MKIKKNVYKYLYTLIYKAREKTTINKINRMNVVIK